MLWELWVTHSRNRVDIGLSDVLEYPVGFETHNLGNVLQEDVPGELEECPNHIHFIVPIQLPPRYLSSICDCSELILTGGVFFSSALPIVQPQ